MNLKNSTFLDDHFDEIARNDIFIQRYIQKYTKNQKRIEVLLDHCKNAHYKANSLSRYPGEAICQLMYFSKIEKVERGRFQLD